MASPGSSSHVVLATCSLVQVHAIVPGEVEREREKERESKRERERERIKERERERERESLRGAFRIVMGSQGKSVGQLFCETR